MPRNQEIVSASDFREDLPCIFHRVLAFHTEFIITLHGHPYAKLVHPLDNGELPKCKVFTVSVLRDDLPRILYEVLAYRIQYVITNHGRPYGRLVPPPIPTQI